MVNRTNVSSWQGPVPTEADLAGQARGIKERKRLYDDADLLALANGGEANLRLWTSDAQRDVAARTWDAEEVLELVRHAIKSGTSHWPEWCVQSPDGPAAACDVFTVFRTEIGRADGVKRLMQYYLKLAISRSGKLLLIASCHTTEK